MYAWIQNLVENQEAFRDPGEFMENVRIDLFPDEVYVFTPRGEIKTFPRGQHPVDFAYMIHSEVGDQCVGAKVNDRMVPLQYELQTGDVIEIVTQQEPPAEQRLAQVCQDGQGPIKNPSMDQNPGKRPQRFTRGEMCEKAFRKYRLNFNALVKSDDMNRWWRALDSSRPTI
jgi:guanosine-3',5'-bis(diphosphate) 3'-pyrophosphohydrolase